MKKKGKILRVKQGYNPNSSSLGSIIPEFLFLSGLAGTLTVFLTALFRKTDRQIREKVKAGTDENNQD